MSRIFWRAIALLVAGTFAGCVMIDSAISPRVINLNLSVDQAQNDSILMNVVRASHSQPLTFVGISKISGSQTSGMSNGLPGFHFGPDLSVSQRQFSFGGNSINNSANGNFDIGH
jgi:hypothetical protein